VKPEQRHSKTQIAPVLLCTLLSPYSSATQINHCVEILSTDEELLELTISLTNRAYLAPALYHQLREHKHLSRFDEQLIAYLREMTHFMQHRNSSLKELTMEVIQISNHNGIAPLLIKGASILFSDIYPDTGMRFMSDLDILYKRDDALKIFNILRKHDFDVPKRYLTTNAPDYYSTGSADTPVTLPRSQHLLPLYREGAPCSIEIHHRPLATFFENFMDCDTAFSSAVKIPELSDKPLTAYRMSPLHEILHCFVHSELAHMTYAYRLFDLRHMDYFVRLVHAHREQINWEQIHSIMRNANAEKTFQHYLFSVNKLFGTNFPTLIKASGQKPFNALYQKRLKSCFPENRFIWKLEKFSLEIRNLLSKRKMASLYEIDTPLALAKARILYLLFLSKKYSNPTRLIARVRYSFS